MQPNAKVCPSPRPSRGPQSIHSSSTVLRCPIAIKEADFASGRFSTMDGPAAAGSSQAPEIAIINLHKSGGSK